MTTCPIANAAASLPIISVTAEDIKNGENGSIFSCPIALAVNRVFPGKVARVGNNHLSIGDSELGLDNRVFYFLPKLAQDFISRVDDPTEFSIPLEPFSFFLITEDQR